MNRRERFRKGLSPLYLPYYDALCNLLGEHWQPYCGLRSLEVQQDLYAKGTSPAKAGESAHNYGCASDWTLWDGGKPIWDVEDPRWREYEQACEKVGLRWLGTIGDAVHNELPLAVRWKLVRRVLDEQGMEAAMKYIAENVQ